MKIVTINRITLSFAAVALGLTIVRAQEPKQPAKTAPKPAPAGKVTPGQLKAQENYKKTCLPCHGPEGKSVLPGMTLADGVWTHGSSLDEIAKTISEGVPKTVMLPNKEKFTPEEIRELAKLVRSFDPKLGKQAPPKK
jgi:mono/diheme cytochrome c family protein